MRCTVLLFAQAKELANLDRMMIELPANALVRDAVELIMQQHPALVPLRDLLALAVDQRYATPQTPLHDGCVIALIPPVSGG
jgi:molybdopterin converting factor subunit 1